MMYSRLTGHVPGRGRRFWSPASAMLALCLFGPLGCKDLTGLQQLPAGTADPTSYDTPAGALAQRTAALNAFISEWPKLVAHVGLFTDEIQVQPQWIVGKPDFTQVDTRVLPAGTALHPESYLTDADYVALNNVRGLTNQALGQLAKYDPSAAPAMRGEMFALQGYAEILLADEFCSGIPLSTLDFQSDYTYAPSSTTAQVYQDAIAKFDSALALSGSDASVLNLARVGKGRALLDVGNYSDAAQAVASVPDGFAYQIAGLWAYDQVNSPMSAQGDADGEGGNGLPFVSSRDPRTAQTARTGYGPHTEPTKIVGQLNSAGYAPFTIADAVEARLIQAEAALQAGDVTTWRTTLNQLRTSGFTTPAPNTIVDTLGVTGCTDANICGGDNGPGPNDDPSARQWGQPANFPPAGYTVVDSFQIVLRPFTTQTRAIYNTCVNDSWYQPCNGFPGYDTVLVYATHPVGEWTAGTGGVSGLDTLADPGTDSGRVSLTFRERAYWLYVTGHRQGDLRRLIRQYHRDPNHVYPTGAYQDVGSYGTDVTAPIPSSEYANPLFHGCIDRNG